MLWQKILPSSKYWDFSPEKKTEIGVVSVFPFCYTCREACQPNPNIQKPALTDYLESGNMQEY